MAMPMANIIAVVAVFEIHAEMKAVTAPKAKRMREGRAPTHLIESTPKASRRSSRWRKMARAIMNDPMKRNIKGSAKGANTSFAGATLRTTHAAAPTSAVTGSGSASVIHSSTTAAITAASLCASGLRPGSGNRSSTANASGATTNPAARRQRSNRASAGLICSTASTVLSISDVFGLKGWGDLDGRPQRFRAARGRRRDALLYHKQFEDVFARRVGRGDFRPEPGRVAGLHVEGDVRDRLSVVDGHPVSPQPTRAQRDGVAPRRVRHGRPRLAADVADDDLEALPAADDERGGEFTRPELRA